MKKRTYHPISMGFMYIQVC